MYIVPVLQSRRRSMVQKVKDWLGALGQNQKLAQGVRWGFQILVVVVFGIMTAMCLFSTH